MADDNDPTLRNALDAVNAGRKWTLLGIAALFFAVLLVLAFMFSMLIPSSVQAPGPAREIAVDQQTGAPGAVYRLVPLKALWVSAAMQLFFVGCGTIAVMLHVSKMTRAILRAIESIRR
jgi:hypothetical protein